MNLGTIIQIALTVIGALGGGYLGVRLSLIRMEVRVDYLEKNLEGLREWKHQTVDPYLPRAMDDLKERVDRIEAKVFTWGSR